MPIGHYDTRMMRFLHTADWHIDSPLEGLSPEKAKLRRGELRSLPEKICRLAEQNHCDFIVVAGDIFDSTRPYKNSVDALRMAFESYAKPVFIVCGNHDYYSVGGLWDKMKMPENVHIFTENRPKCVKIGGANVYGASYIASHIPPNLEGFRAEANAENLLILHGDVPKGIADMGINYLALGHIHKPSGLQSQGKCHYAYCGTAQGRGFDECGLRTVSIVSIDGGFCKSEELEVAERRHEILQVQAEDFPNCLQGLDPQNLYRIVLKGVAKEKITDRIFQYACEDSGLFYAEMRDMTRAQYPEYEEHSLPAKLKQIAEARLQNCTDEREREQIERALVWAMSAAENSEEPWECYR